MIGTRAKRSLTADKATKPVSAGPNADLEAWHDQKTRQAIKEAEAGDFATPDEVKRVVRRYIPGG